MNNATAKLLSVLGSPCTSCVAVYIRNMLAIYTLIIFGLSSFYGHNHSINVHTTPGLHQQDNMTQDLFPYPTQILTFNPAFFSETVPVSQLLKTPVLLLQEHTYETSVRESKQPHLLAHRQCCMLVCCLHT